MTKLKKLPDIDVDLQNRQQILDVIKHVPATLGDGKKHNTGVYCQPIPVNPLTGCASIDYKTAEARGYFKIDFLNVSAYNGVKNEEHLVRLLNAEPLWDLLGEKEVCDQLFHVNGYHDLVKRLQPRSVVELAMFLALLRPGKKHLIPVCEKEGFEAIKDEIWIKTDDAYFFKKSHAISYASVIVVQLNFICERISYEYS